VNRIILLTIFALFLTACAFGFIEIRHEKGSMPKVRANISDECKIKFRKESARVFCEWELSSMFDIKD